MDDLLSMTDLLIMLNLSSLGHLTFCLVFKKTLRVGEASRSNKDGKVFQPVRVKQAWAGGGCPN